MRSGHPLLIVYYVLNCDPKPLKNSSAYSAVFVDIVILKLGPLLLQNELNISLLRIVFLSPFLPVLFFLSQIASSSSFFGFETKS